MLFATLSIKAQTVTINYANWAGNTNCNIFSSAVTIDGYAHLTAIGQPRFTNSGSNKYVTLDASNVNMADSKGTEYRIAYPFKAGYAYTIKINAAAIGTPATAHLRTNILSFTGTNTLCNGVATISPATSGNLIMSNQVYANFTDLYYNYSPMANNQSFLTIAAIQPYGSAYQTLCIRSITITETQVSADLVLSPTSLSATCGQSLSQTFSLANPHNVTGITSYVWTVGSGWRYNGNPAPATITTTTPSLALTTNCLSANPGNISVAVYKGSGLYKTYNAATNYNGTPPAITLDGPAGMCSSSTTPVVFTASSFWSCPPGVTYTWSKSSNLTLTGSGNSVSVLPVAGQSGAAWVEVTASSNCGTSTVRKNLTLDIMPAATGGTYTGGYPPLGGVLVFDRASNVACGLNQYTQVSVDLVGVTGFSTLTVDVPPPGIMWGWAGNYFYLDFLEENQHAYFTGTLQNTCGTVTVNMLFVQYNCPEVELVKSDAFVAYPNPAISYLLVEPNRESKSANTKDPFTIQLFNENGTLLKSMHNAGGDARINVPTGNLPQGTYYLHIQQGKKLYKKQISIKR